MVLAPAVVVLLAGVGPAAPENARTVTIRFFGGPKKEPIAGLTVTPCRGDYAVRKKVAEGATDKTGAIALRLQPGRYYVDISPAKPLPYLRLPVGYEGHPVHYARVLVVDDRPAQTHEFHLAAATKLTLRAVDADTGKGIPGVALVTENALGEVWGVTIVADNIGWKSTKESDAEATDADGNFTRMVGPRPGYTYFAWTRPMGYEPVGRAEVELPTPVGTEAVEHVFRFRKKK